MYHPRTVPLFINDAISRNDPMEVGVLTVPIDLDLHPTAPSRGGGGGGAGGIGTQVGFGKTNSEMTTAGQITPALAVVQWVGRSVALSVDRVGSTAVAVAAANTFTASRRSS